MLQYANSIKSAELRYTTHRNTDPFPEISPALLTSADIQDYVSATGMLFPFSTNPDSFKPASYSINFSGEYLFWDIIDGRKVKIKKILKKGESFTLKRNSITYIKLEPYFQLPNYIAARFNLQIKHVYRGLLLGTGPLVDPGYIGFLNIPIHNLTDEDYEIEYGEPIIWMEFTKLNPNKFWTDNVVAPRIRDGRFYEFKSSSNNQPMEFFLHKAHPNSPIISTMNGLKVDIEKLKNETNELNKQSKENNDNTSKAVAAFNRAIIVAVIAVCVTLGVTIFQTVTVHEKAIDYINIYGQKVSEINDKGKPYDSTVIFLREKIINLEDRIIKQQLELDKLKE